MTARARRVMMGPILSERLWIVAGYFMGLLYVVIHILWWAWRDTPSDQHKD
jgi:hypothetical protein